MDEETLFVLLCGGAGIGKTSVVRRFLENRFIAARKPTIGTDIISVPLPPLACAQGSRPALLLLCDPSHLEYRNDWPRLAMGASAHGFLLVIDPWDPETLREADAWLLRARNELRLGQFEEHSMLLAHKHDIVRVGEPPLGMHQLDSYCAQRGLMGWMHTSAKYGRSVHEAIERLLESMALPLLSEPADDWTHEIVAPKRDERTVTARLRAVEKVLAEGGGAWPRPQEEMYARNREYRENLQAEALRQLRRQLYGGSAEQAYEQERAAVPSSTSAASVAEQGNSSAGLGGQSAPAVEPAEPAAAATEPRTEWDGMEVWQWEECARLVKLSDDLAGAHKRREPPWHGPDQWDV